MDDQAGAISTATILGAIAGQLVLGRVGDLTGRRKIMVFTSILTILGSGGSALAVSLGRLPKEFILIFWRFILGMGVGGEYPLSASLSSETSSSESRGRNTLAMFSMQGVGMLVCPIVVLIILSLGVSMQVAWRLSLAFGILPSILALYFRLRMEESEKFLRAVETSGLASHRWKLIGTAGSWFLIDVTFYANGGFSEYFSFSRQMGN